MELLDASPWRAIGCLSTAFWEPRHDPRVPSRLARALVAFAVVGLLSLAEVAHAQTGYFASIAYSQSTGRIGYSVRQARTKAGADSYAIRMCAARDAKVFMWARDQWVAIAVVDGHIGNAGFGRGSTSARSSTEGARRMRHSAPTAPPTASRCAFTASGRREARAAGASPATPAKSKTGFFAALAFSPSTGKIGATAGKAKTLDEAKKLALKDCDAPDAKVFMWGDLWIAVAVAPDKPGIAGFGPGATREAAEKAALEQATKFAKGAPVQDRARDLQHGRREPDGSARVRDAAGPRRANRRPCGDRRRRDAAVCRTLARFVCGGRFGSADRPSGAIRRLRGNRRGSDA